MPGSTQVPGARAGAGGPDDRASLCDLDPAFDLNVFTPEAAPPRPSSHASAEPRAAPIDAGPVVPARAPQSTAPPPAPYVAAPPDSAPLVETGARAFAPVEQLRRRLAERAHAAAPQPGAAAGPRRWSPLAAIAGVAILLAAAGGALWWGWLGSTGGPSRVAIESTPTGAMVIVDGERLGTTPRTLLLDAGPHKVRLEHGGTTHDMDLNVSPGRDASHHVYLRAGTAQQADNSGATAPRDRRARAAGTTGTQVPRFAAPKPSSAAAPSGTRAQRTPVAAPAAAPQPPRMPDGSPAGWLAIQAPVELALSVDGRSLAPGPGGAFLVAAGTHTLVAASERVGFTWSEPVTVASGERTVVRIDVPPGALSLNAQPWAEVFVDDQPLGETPLGEVSLAAGVHRIVFRHPELGERAYEALVRAGQHTRLSVDLRR